MSKKNQERQDDWSNVESGKDWSELESKLPREQFKFGNQLIITILMFFFAGIGCSNETPQMEEVAPLKSEPEENLTTDIGSQSVEVEGRVVTIERVHRGISLDDEQPVGEFFVVEGTIENISNETGDLTWSNFHITDAQGRQYSDASLSAQYEAQRKYDAKGQSKDIPPGLTIKFAVAFDIHPSATNLELIWQSMAWGAEDKIINLTPQDSSTSTFNTNQVTVSSRAQETKNHSSEKDNPFEEMSFPQSSCGDRLPSNPDKYPILFYPVYTTYSQSNIEQINSSYCTDALRITRDSGESSIQVASFASYERAQFFRDFFTTRLGSAEIGEPRTITRMKQEHKD